MCLQVCIRNAPKYAARHYVLLVKVSDNTSIFALQGQKSFYAVMSNVLLKSRCPLTDKELAMQNSLSHNAQAARFNTREILV